MQGINLRKQEHGQDNGSCASKAAGHFERHTISTIMFTAHGLMLTTAAVVLAFLVPPHPWSLGML
jgi:hypothetical protein